MKRKPCRTILMVITLAGLFSGCEQPTPETIVNTVEVTRVVQKEPEPIVETIIVTVAPSPTPPATSEENGEVAGSEAQDDGYTRMVEEELVYGDRTILFELTHPSDEDIFKRWGGYGDYSIVGFELNDSNPTASDQLRDFVFEGLRQIYLIQNPHASIELDEFVADSDASVRVYTKVSGESETVRIADIRKVRYNLTNDSQYLASLPSRIGRVRLGFEWQHEEAILTVHAEPNYLSIRSIVGYYQDGISLPGGCLRRFDPGTYPYYIGRYSFNFVPYIALIGASSHLWGTDYNPSEAEREYLSVFNEIKDEAGMYKGFTDETVVDSECNDLVGPYLREHSIFKAVTPPEISD